MPAQGCCCPGPGSPRPPARWPPLTVAALDARLDRLGEWVRTYAWGRPVYVSHFGVFERADDTSALTYLRAVRAAFERNGFGWAAYDYASGCAVRDAAGRPTRVLDGLFRR